MPFLAPEMQQVLAGILAAILWIYFQGGRMFFKKMKSDEIELLRSDCAIKFVDIWLFFGLNSFLKVRFSSFSKILPRHKISLTFCEQYIKWPNEVKPLLYFLIEITQNPNFLPD